MNPLNWIRRINAELSAARERSRIERFNRAMRKRRVVLPSPRPDAVAGNWYGDRKAQ